MTLHRLIKLLVTITFICSAVTINAEVLLRKNIDKLSAEELSAYEHAVQILKDRSAANPYDKNGNLWQAWIHNCPGLQMPISGQGTADTIPICDFWMAKNVAAGNTFENPVKTRPKIQEINAANHSVVLEIKQRLSV